MRFFGLGLPELLIIVGLLVVVAVVVVVIVVVTRSGSKKPAQPQPGQQPTVRQMAMQPQPMPGQPQPMPGQPVAPPPVQPQPAAAAGSPQDELLRWHQLLEQGVISQEEFDKKKLELLSSNS
jgi:hypothetical protein